MRISRRAIIGVFSAAFVCVAGLLVWRVFSWVEEESCCHRSWCEIVADDTLRVGTLRTSISAFQYRGRWRGYEYEMVSQVASELNLNLKLSIADNEQDLLDSLAAGSIDLVAWPTGHRVLTERDEFRPCGYTYEMDFCTLSLTPIEVTEADSARYRLAVVENSRQWYIMQDTAFQRHFPLKAFVVDTLSPVEVKPYELIQRLRNGQFDLVLVASNVGRMLKKLHKEFYLGDGIEGSGSNMSWMVSRCADTLAAKIDSVCRFDYNVPEYRLSARRTFELSSIKYYNRFVVHRQADGSLTGYDDLFVEYADSIGWDWRMLASLSMCESGWKNDLVSAKGARGLMQLMPVSAARFGCPEDSLMVPRYNIRTAARALRQLENALRKRMMRSKNPEVVSYNEADSALKAEVDKDLIWFTLASYNAGLGHVFDAIALADTLGYDPAVWHHNVEHCLNLKSQESYYSLPCVRLGCFNSAVTRRYVRDVVDMGEFLISEDVLPKLDSK